MLTALLPRLSGAALSEAVQMSGWIADERSRDEAAIRLSPFLPAGACGEHGRRISGKAEGFEGNRRAELLTTLIPCLPTAEREVTVKAALAAAQGLGSRYQRVEALIRLLPYLSLDEQERLRKDLLKLIEGMQHRTSRARALDMLAPHLGENVAWVIGTMHRLVLEALLLETLGLDDKEAICKALARLATFSFMTFRVMVLRIAFHAFTEIKSVEGRTRALVEMLPHIPTIMKLNCCFPPEGPSPGAAAQEFLDKVCEDIRNNSQSLALIGHNNELTEARALIGLGLITDRGEEAKEWQHQRIRDRRIQSIMPAVEADRIQASMSVYILAMFPGPHLSHWIASSLTLHVPDLPERLLTLLPHLESESDRASLLESLAPHLSGAQLHQALSTVFRMASGQHRSRALAKLTACLAHPRLPELQAAWQEFLSVSSSLTRADLLADLGAMGELLTALGGNALVGEVIRDAETVGRWWR